MPASADDPEPGVGSRQRRPEAHQQKTRPSPLWPNAGRPMTGVGAAMALRQPEVERELRALGEGAEQDQHQRRQVERMARMRSPAASTASRS